MSESTTLRAVRAAAGAAAAAAVLAHAGRLAPALDVLAHLAPVYAGLAAIILVGGVFWSKRVAPAARIYALVALAAAGLLMAPEFVRSTGPRAAGPAGGEIKIVHLKTAPSSDVDRLVVWIASATPDFVVVTGAEDALRDRLLARGWAVAGGQGSLMIFSRQRYVRMVRPKGAEPLWFVNATYPAPQGEIEVVATHLAWPTDPIVRGQTQGLRKVVGERPRRDMILVGDLNATPWSARLRRLDRDLGLIRRDRAVATWPASVLGVTWPAPFLPLDHLYAGEGWATVSVSRGPALGLGHYPLMVTLRPSGQPQT
jgi:endonuclease/exonuclease/phosphatase (EEP) superfamily protein YafD